MDKVICPLVLNYIKDWNRPLQEFNRVLVPGGLFVLSTQHPFFDYIYFKSKNYFETEKVKCTWRGFDKPIEVESYRKPISQCINDEEGYEELMSFPGFLFIYEYLFI